MEDCEWHIVDDENHYESGCGGEWFFFKGTVKENQMIFCPFCGEPITEHESIV